MTPVYAELIAVLAAAAERPQIHEEGGGVPRPLQHVCFGFGSAELELLPGDSYQANVICCRYLVDASVYWLPQTLHPV